MYAYVEYKHPRCVDGNAVMHLYVMKRVKEIGGGGGDPVVIVPSPRLAG